MRQLSAIFVLLLLSVSAFSQSIINPNVERWDENNCRVTKIEVTDQYTVISFEHTNLYDKGWVTLYDGIYLQSTTDDSRYPFVKAENIPLKPEKYYYKETGEVLAFKVYFKKLEPQVKSIDIIERAGATNYFNFFGVSLERSRPDVAQNNTPKRQPGQEEERHSMMESLMPMYSEMLKMVLGAQVAYFNQPEKVAEIARINKSYYEALLKEGFSKKQALEIMTSNPLVQQVSADK